MRTTSMLFFIALTAMRFGPTQDRVREDDERRIRQVLTDYTDSWNKHDMQTFAAVFTQDVDYVNIAGRHWKGVEQNVAEHTKRFQTTLKNTVQTPTSVEVRFLRPDVALIHTTWDVTGWSRPNGEEVSVLKEITTMVLVKNRGKWLISAFQNTEVRP